ncbi:microcystin LR degradation protein MlrC-like protein (plasmid) [Sulfitobacter alexandrii]|uniref:Microcystinase C n=1 Tax=Sulfitobacter alexandrii TaxID=1917485 RepID=A0A1J0WP06_9RHOB|nr:M81 family metallopeptidase [Sulfitobacter alexandrii]APE45971.1 microcystin LR degradation protein MlrC-like protein [Sulfitobacter alexandrii]
MKLFMASLATETNSFSPIPTGWSGFREHLYTKEASRGEAGLYAAAVTLWRRRAEALGWEVVEGLSTYAQPAGPTVREVYETMRDDILNDLKAAMPVDVVLLSMHGAMIAQGYDDCEGDLLARARAIIGPDAKLGLEVDPHCHLTEAMLENATAIICYKEYPHIDVPERADELFTICADAAAGRTDPVMRDYDCRMMAMYHTPFEPVRSYVDRMSAMEGRDGILSVSLAHGFPWGDNPRCGTRTLVITDADARLAADRAEALGRELWDMRDDLRRFPPMDEGLDRAVASNAAPVVLADFADNAGGGAPSDSTYVLRAIMERGLRDVAIGTFWDPVLVGMCMDAGVGAVMDVRVGGKIGPMSGDPVDLTVTVRGIVRDAIQHLGKAEMNMGDCVWLETSEGIHLVMNTRRTQTFHPEAFENLGLDLSGMKYVVVKSSQHFYDGFAPMAGEVIHLGTPGAITPDFANLPLTKRDGNYWPRVDNPFE